MYYLVADPVLERLEDCYARMLLSSAISESREDLRRLGGLSLMNMDAAEGTLLLW